MTTFRIPAKQGRIRVAPKADRTYNGMVYHSKAEARFAAELDLKKKAGLIRDWWGQVHFCLKVNGKEIGSMVIDFSVVDKDGKQYYVEVKGQETAKYKLQRNILLACYPNIDYRVVKAR